MEKLNRVPIRLIDQFNNILSEFSLCKKYLQKNRPDFLNYVSKRLRESAIENGFLLENNCQKSIRNHIYIDNFILRIEEYCETIAD